jgi:hypothetical protein
LLGVLFPSRERALDYIFLYISDFQKRSIKTLFRQDLDPIKSLQFSSLSLKISKYIQLNNDFHTSEAMLVWKPFGVNGSSINRTCFKNYSDGRVRDAKKEIGEEECATRIFVFLFDQGAEVKFW